MTSHLHEPLVVEGYANGKHIVEKHQTHSAQRLAEEMCRARHPGQPEYHRAQLTLFKKNKERIITINHS